MRIDIVYFDGRTSLAEQGTLCFNETGLSLKVGDSSRLYAWDQFRISERLGSTPRVIQFTDGGRAEIADNAAVDACLWQFRGKGNWLHQVEASLPLALGALAGLVLVVWLMIQFGVPAAAKHMASLIPPAADKTIGEQALQSLDDSFFEPSELDPAHQQRLTARFRHLVGMNHPRHEFELLFRKSEALGANAFALPSGSIILLDDLVQLAENDNEVLSVLAHEIGHVVHRHGLRTVIQNSAIVLLISTLVGDVFTSSSLASAIPLMLVDSSYSREFEREADIFAKELMLTNNIPLHTFPDLLERISDSHDDANLPAFLSSHPDTEERVKAFR